MLHNFHGSLLLPEVTYLHGEWGNQNVNVTGWKSFYYNHQDCFFTWQTMWTMNYYYFYYVYAITEIAAVAAGT